MNNEAYGFRSKVIMKSNIQLVVTIGTILISYLYPSTMEKYSAYLMTISIVTFGIPHGALDHILYYELETIRNELPEKKKYGPFVHSLFFYINYLVIMLLWAACWDSHPDIAFWSFLLVSSYHFGEGDLDYIQGISNYFKLLLYFSRGVMIVGLTLTTQPRITLPIVQKLIEINPIGFIIVCDMLQPLVVIQHLIVLFLLFKRPVVLLHHTSTQPFPIEPKAIDSKVCFYELMRSILYVSLYLFTNPLIGFSIFFGIWHSTETAWTMIKFLKTRRYPRFENSSSVTLKDIFSFYSLAAPFTIVSIAGMVTVYSARSVVGMDELDPYLVWAVFICCISILTGSHMWVLTALHWSNISLDPCNLGVLFGAEQAKKRIKSKM
jgi:beta-carotene 15,15'-dioxygenase